MKAKVSERALIARINRRLAKENEKLIVCEETSPSFTDLGRYYVVDLNQNIIGSSNLDLEQVGRDTESLKGYEVLEDADQGETITAKFADLPDKDTVQDAEPELDPDAELDLGETDLEFNLRRIKAESGTWIEKADRLNDDGILPKRAKKWTAANLERNCARLEGGSHAESEW